MNRTWRQNIISPDIGSEATNSAGRESNYPELTELVKPELREIPVARGQLNNPSAVAIDPQGNLWVADEFAHSLLRLGSRSSAGEPKAIAKFGSQGSGPGQFYYPRGITFRPFGDGEILVSDSWNHRVQAFRLNGEFLWSLGEFRDKGLSPGKGKTVGFYEPWGITCRRDGSFYVVDSSNHRVLRFAADKKEVGEFGGMGKGEGKLFYPRGICLDEENRLWIADWGNGRIQCFTSDGDFLHQFPATAPGEQGRSNPCDIAIHRGQYLFVVDDVASRIKVFSPEGAFLFALGEQGDRPHQFNIPLAISVVNHDELVVADSFNSRLVRIKLELPGIETLMKALAAIDPEDFPVSFHLANRLLRRADTAGDALKLYYKVEAILPDCNLTRWTYMLNRDYCQLLVKKYSDLPKKIDNHINIIVSDAMEVKKKLSEYETTHIGLLKDEEEAFRKIKQNPNNEEAKFKLVDINLELRKILEEIEKKKGEKATAEKLLLKLKELKGLCLWLEGKPSDALDQWESCLQDNPLYEPVRRYLQKIKGGGEPTSADFKIDIGLPGIHPGK